jgi:hypothetical protein
MQIPRLQFPHISRVFSALLWILLILFISFNIFAVTKNMSLVQMIISSNLTHPFSVESHIKTAMTLWNQGLQSKAIEEIRIADDLYQGNDSSVLGITSSPSSILSDWESQPQKLQNDYLFWKSVIEKRPDYRDGYIMAGIYAYQMQNKKESVSLFQKAHDLDPNYAPLNTLLEKIGK